MRKAIISLGVILALLAFYAGAEVYVNGVLVGSTDSAASGDTDPTTLADYVITDTASVSLLDTNIATATATLSGLELIGRKARVYTSTTNAGEILTLSLKGYDTSAAVGNELFHYDPVYISAGYSPSNYSASATTLYVDGINLNEGVTDASLLVETSGGASEVVVLDSMDSSVQTAWTKSYEGAQELIWSLATYNGKLYAGQGAGAGDGDVLVFDGDSWTTSYDGAQEYIMSLAVYNGKLYASQGLDTGDGDVLVFDGDSWSTSYDGAEEQIRALAVYNGKLYAGQGSGTGDGDIFVFDGDSWTTSYDGAQEYILGLAVYNGKLYAGQGSGTGDADVLVFDGDSWSTSYDGAQEFILGLGVYNGKLYAGQGSGTGDGDVLVFDGDSWSTSYDGAQEFFYGFAVYNGKLYAGQANDTGDGDVLVFDGTSWSTSYDGAQEAIYGLAVYNGKLYAGQTTETGDGDVYVLDTEQSLTLQGTGLANAHTNPVISVIQDLEVGQLADSVVYEVESADVGAVSNTTITIITEGGSE